MIKLFSFWRSLATYRVRIALNLKGITVDEVRRGSIPIKGHQHHPAYRVVNPMMALPALVDGDGPHPVRVARDPRPPTRPAPSRRCSRRMRAGRARGAASPRSSPANPHPLVVPRRATISSKRFNLPRGRADGTGARHWDRGRRRRHRGAPQGAADAAPFCHGDEITIADICLASQGAGARFYRRRHGARIRTSPASSPPAWRTMRLRGRIRCAPAGAPAQV